MRIIIWLMLWFCFFAFGLFVFTTVEMRRNDKTEWCDSRGGVMLKSVTKWVCVDIQVFK